MYDALIILDIQNDYFPGGSMELAGAEAAGRAAAGMLTRFRQAGRPVVHIRHESVRAGATFFLPGTPGAEIHHLVTPQPGEAVLTKRFPNAFRDTGLRDLLRGLGAERLAMCGMMTHMCVDASVRAAFDLDYACGLAADACATRDLEYAGRVVAAADVQAAYLAALGAVFATVVPALELAPL
ncbi:MAG: cysteine hydrolase [Desulfovibrionaceae bacterium CG1_02_65_16]|nr:MAG: cysteine hydrolase [Desulfovibrionaceae bacterium CG1_02_65_16]